MIRVEEYRGVRAFDDLGAAWARLHRDSGAAPFLAPFWLAAWHRHLAPHVRPRLVAARDRAGELVGLLPLFEEDVGIAGFPVGRRLGLLGERTGGADYLDVIARPHRRGEVAEAIVDHLLRTGGFDLLDLSEVPADSALLPSLCRIAGEVEIAPRHVCPQVELAETWEAVLARSRRADNLRRRRRQAEALGAIYRVVREPAEAPAAFEHFLELHEKRWERAGGSDGIRSPAHVRFHREVVVHLAQAGWLRFEELWIGGACRASIYGIETGSTYAFYQSGYDPAWASRSVGLVLLGMSLERAVRRGLEVYDFLHGVESYKLDWATRARQTLRIRASRGTAVAAWMRAREEAERRARAWLRSALPQSAVERLRRQRKARAAQAMAAERTGRAGAVHGS